MITIFIIGTVFGAVVGVVLHCAVILAKAADHETEYD